MVDAKHMPLQGKRVFNIASYIGKKYGRLTVVEQLGKNKFGHSMMLCKCECGNKKAISISNLRTTKSCGCLKRELDLERPRQISIKHGDSHSKLYGIWKDMRRRCNPKFSDKYPYHAGKGIRVCKDWDEWATFKEWAYVNGYREGLTIDRIDGNGDYRPENCRWATRREQCNNLKSNVYVSYEGARYTIGELARAKRIKYQPLRDRIRDKGWSVERAVQKGLDELKAKEARDGK